MFFINFCNLFHAITVIMGVFDLLMGHPRFHLRRWLKNLNQHHPVFKMNSGLLYLDANLKI